jgi:hypothetical protein
MEEEYGYIDIPLGDKYFIRVSYSPEKGTAAICFFINNVPRRYIIIARDKYKEFYEAVKAIGEEYGLF